MSIRGTNVRFTCFVPGRHELTERTQYRRCLEGRYLHHRRFARSCHLPFGRPISLALLAVVQDEEFLRLPLYSGE